MSEEKVLVYDIECKTLDGHPNAEKDELRVFACYSYATGKNHFLTSLNEIREIIERHDYFVGFNNLLYDNVVLKRYFPNVLELDFNERFNANQAYFKFKYNIDLRQVFEKRCKIIIVGKDLLDDILLRYDLDTVSKTIGIIDDEREGKIKDFDYSLLAKPEWTSEEKEVLREYALRDVELTQKLYEWLEDYFQGFKDFVSPKNVRNKAYLKCSPSAFAYKAICHHLGLEEEYEDIEEDEDETYGGGYVAYPAGESFDESQGDIYLLDFKSLYPHINLQCNLFSPSASGWNGNGVFKTQGVYDDKNQGRIEQFLLSTYKKREEYKRNKDPREYALKIIMNAIYGLSSSKRFKHLHHPFTASDCTALGRQWVQLARKRFREAGYVNIFSDTDSVCLLDKSRDKQKLQSVKQKILEEIKASVPFPSDTFDIGIDALISNIWFFKGKQKKDEEDKYMDEDDHENKKKGLLKKNYIYLTKAGEIKVKNLGVRKKSVSLLARHVFWKVLAPKIKEERRVKFPREFLDRTISGLLEQDISLAAIRYSVKASETYKKESQLQAQIAKNYGPGIHFLIPNKSIGVGKAKLYCTLEEFKDNGLGIKDIDLENVWKELDYFVEEEQPPLSPIFNISNILISRLASMFILFKKPKDERWLRKLLLKR